VKNDPNDKRSSLPCPAIIRNRSRGGAVGYRQDMKEAAEQSILNNRHFTDKPVAGDESPAYIRKHAKERKTVRVKRKDIGL
jgi:hypothetical protein